MSSDSASMSSSVRWRKISAARSEPRPTSRIAAFWRPAPDLRRGVGRAGWSQGRRWPCVRSSSAPPVRSLRRLPDLRGPIRGHPRIAVDLPLPLPRTRPFTVRDTRRGEADVGQRAADIRFSASSSAGSSPLIGRYRRGRHPRQGRHLTGVAAAQLTRLIARDKVTSFIREPFTRLHELRGRRGDEAPRGRVGATRSASRRLPHCLAQWIAGSFRVGHDDALSRGDRAALRPSTAGLAHGRCVGIVVANSQRTRRQATDVP